MSAPADPNTRTVLVVEDDEAVRSMLDKALSRKYTVIVAKDGLEAAELLGQIKRLDLVVCDVMMPHIDGFSLVRMMRSKPELKSIPVLFLSAKSAPQAIVDGMNLGAKHYMTKPFSVKELVDRVGKLLGTS